MAYLRREFKYEPDKRTEVVYWEVIDSIGRVEAILRQEIAPSSLWLWFLLDRLFKMGIRGRNILSSSWKGWIFLRLWDILLFCPCMVLSRGVMVQVGISFSMGIYYNDCVMWLEVTWR